MSQHLPRKSPDLKHSMVLHSMQWWATPKTTSKKTQTYKYYLFMSQTPKCHLTAQLSSKYTLKFWRWRQETNEERFNLRILFLSHLLVRKGDYKSIGITQIKWGHVHRGKIFKSPLLLLSWPTYCNFWVL